MFPCHLARQVKGTNPATATTIVDHRCFPHGSGGDHDGDISVDEALAGIQYPRVPGHEVVGILDKLGAGVTVWQPGQRVGVGL